MVSENRKPLTLPLSKIGRGDLLASGGKGANLGELARSGFPVPAGFVVTTAAYDSFVGHNNLDETVFRVLRQKQDSALIRSAFEASSIPTEIVQAILSAYKKMGQIPVAVRSSATSEDLPDAAFAGQHETILNVTGEEPLLSAIRRCWASLWTGRAISYRERLGLDQRTVKLGVVVQSMVSADFAGVLFTANPVTGVRNETIVDSSGGLGETVVSGMATPEHFVLKKRPWGWAIVERRPGRREMTIKARAAGGTELMEGPADSRVSVIPVAALRKLADLGASIQHHLGSPQDIEWALAAGELYILQSRPMTALPDPPPHPNRLQRISAAMFSELLPARPYPLEVTTFFASIFVFLPRLLSILGFAAPRFEQLFKEDEGVVVRFTGWKHFHPTPLIMFMIGRLIWSGRSYDYRRWHTDPLLADAQSRVRSLEASDLQTLSWGKVLAVVHEALEIVHLIAMLRIRYMARPLLAVIRLRVVLWLTGHGNSFGALLFSGVETKTLEANLALEDLATRIRSEPALAEAFAKYRVAELWTVLEALPSGRPFLAELRAFLDRYGHREAGATFLVSQSTWRTSPEVVLGMLKGMAIAGPSPGVRRPEWEMARDHILAHFLFRLPGLRSSFLKLLTEARFFTRIREDTRFYITLSLPVLYRTILELDRRLVSAGVLDTPRDIVHFKLDELEQMGETWPPSPRTIEKMRALSLRRKHKRMVLEGVPLVDPRLISRPVVKGKVLLQGIPASPGVAEGPVRIIHDSSEFSKLRLGEVLVAPYTNPAWTPLFMRAVAVVADRGAALSHAAITAREYGIPAVMGTLDGTQRLVDGERVRVDGTRGMVFSAPLERHVLQ